MILTTSPIILVLIEANAVFQILIDEAMSDMKGSDEYLNYPIIAKTWQEAFPRYSSVCEKCIQVKVTVAAFYHTSRT